MSRYVIISSELIEIFPTPSGLHSFIPNVVIMEKTQELIDEMLNKQAQIITQNDKIIELLEQIADNTQKGKPPKDK